MKARLAVLAAPLAAAALALTACGSAQTEVADSNPAVESGSHLFVSHCSGCHTLDSVGTEGSATKVTDRERVDGPNFNVRKECKENVLYAIENGGYSGAIMPQNLVTGQDAQHVAAFLAKYSGLQRKTTAGGAPVVCNGKP